MIAPNDPIGGSLPNLPENPEVIDSSNAFTVIGRGDGNIGIYKLAVKHLTKKQALNLAAWLSVIADPDGKEFEQLVKEIRGK